MPARLLTALTICCTLGSHLAPFASAAEPVAAAAAAKQVDGQLAREWGLSGAAAMTASDDATFLRRAMLDLAGRLPTPEELTAFLLDPSADKRAKFVDRMLDRPEFGRNWARYWRDVILYRRTEDRALLASQSCEDFLAQQFNDNVGWDKIAETFITATGDVSENGATALIMAQSAETADVTAEVSRIFLGIQISCAQCHDHPTDSWKRQQFHELAAFFPRVTLRRIVEDGRQVGFEVVGVDRERRGRRPMNLPGGSLEHYMPDLQAPESQGNLVAPKYFVTGQSIKTGVNDATRRATIAEWLSAGQDQWFAKAFVNRIWGELVGRGFYEPLDDLGPQRECSAPDALAYLASDFASHDYDVKRLFRIIMATSAYQRSLAAAATGQARAANEVSESSEVELSEPQRVRADQLFDSLLSALGLPEPAPPAGGQYGQQAVLGSARFRFAQVFGFDPSEPRDELKSTIPQALMMMNGREIAGQINARNSRTALGKLMLEIKKDEDLVAELYLRVLAREPSKAEIKTAIDYVRQVRNREEAFEDILWALINSTEFLHRR